MEEDTGINLHSHEHSIMKYADFSYFINVTLGLLRFVIIGLALLYICNI